MQSPEPDEEEDEAQEADESTPPGFWLLQVLRDMVGGPDKDEDE